MSAKTWLPANPIGFPSGGLTTNAFVAAWIEDFRQAMLDIGLTQTADTGQFDAGAFAFTYNGNIYGAVGPEQTYLMFAMNDDLHDDYPLFIRIGFRVCGGDSKQDGYAPATSVQVGTGTSGAGLLTGRVSSAMTYGAGYGNVNAYTLTPRRQSWACLSKEKGFLGVMFAPGSRFHKDYDQRFAVVAFFLERVPDAFGSPTGDGFTLWARNVPYFWIDASSNDQNYSRVMTAAAQTVMLNGFNSGAVTHAVPYIASSQFLDAGDIYLNHAYHTCPTPVRSVGLAAVSSVHDVSEGALLEFTPYGTVPSTFVSIGYGAAFRPCGATTSANPCFLFE